MPSTTTKGDKALDPGGRSLNHKTMICQSKSWVLPFGGALRPKVIYINKILQRNNHPPTNPAIRVRFPSEVDGFFFRGGNYMGDID